VWRARTCSPPLTGHDQAVYRGYLLIMGAFIIYKAFRNNPHVNDGTHDPRVSVLGLFGGFCDAIGGGGWGPVVTTTLVARGKNPR
jgi:uncharacterized protein